MSETRTRDMAQRLQDIQEGLNALLNTRDIEPETLSKTILVAYQLVERWETLRPEEIDDQEIRDVEELVQSRYTSNADTQAEEIVICHEQGGVFFGEFRRLGDLHDLEQAITSWQKAVDLTPDRHPALPTHLSNLAIAVLARFEYLGSDEDLEAGISQSRKAVDLTPDSHFDSLSRLKVLGGALEMRYERSGLLVDLDEAIIHMRRVAALTPNGHSDESIHLNILGDALAERFRRSNSLADAEEATLLIRKAVDLTPQGHPNKLGHLDSLCNVLEGRFHRYGLLADLDETILQRQRMVNLTPDDHIDKPSYLENLGNLLEERSTRSGSLADLEEAIVRKRKAVNLTPDDHPNKPARLSGLGNALKARFERHGSLADLEEAILLQRTAVRLAPDDHPDKSGCINDLGTALQTRFDRYGSFADLEEAILQKRMAVDRTPDDHPDKLICLNNLGIALESRFKQHGSLADLEDALLQMRKAADLTPDSHADKPQRLNNLGNILEQMFQRNESLSDLNDSIMYRQKAVFLMPTGDPDRAMCLINLSLTLRTRFEHLGDRNDLQHALSAAQEAAEFPAASSRVQLQGALLWAGFCVLGSTSPFRAFKYAIELLPRVAWPGITADDQYFLLAEVGPAALAAVEAATTEGEYRTAIEWAEQGRSIVWQNLLSLRTPLDRLQIRYPELATRLQELSQYLERSAVTGNVLDGSNTSTMSGSQTALALERDRLIDEIRSKPDFEGFMKPRSLKSLSPAARDGPVIFLNLGETRCDALALMLENNGAPYVVPILLERVTLQKTEDLYEKFVKLLSGAGVRARDSRKHKVHGALVDKETVFKEILQSLWLDYVQPILDGLAYQVNLESPPRLWWCTSGPLAFLPLHAAGLYDSKEVGHKVSDYVVSSYTPTLTALLDKPSPVTSEEPKILTVAISDTPGAPLPCTEEEVRNLRQLAANIPVVSLTNGEATNKRVIEELKDSGWAHLACHGEQVGGKPMESGLILHDGKLKLSEIVKARLPNAEFAFLSACQTAVGDGGVPEESAHLAAGMLFAGYRGVVATMWSIQDDIEPRVAEDFYRYLFRNGQPKREEAAYALHNAVRSLQESGVAFTSWVPFIHIGR